MGAKVINMTWKMPDNFDGAKFAERYALTINDFYASDGNLILSKGVTIPDDPPIMDLCDTPEEIAKKAAEASFNETSELHATIKVLNERINVLEALSGIKVSTFDETKAAVVAEIKA